MWNQKMEIEGQTTQWAQKDRVLKTIINNTLNTHDKETRTQHKVV